jgi:hypothetical protein
MSPVKAKGGSKQASKPTTRHDTTAAEPAESEDGAGKVHIKAPAGRSTTTDGGDAVSDASDGDTIGIQMTVRKHRRRFVGCRRGTAALFVVLLAVIWGLWNEVSLLQKTRVLERRCGCLPQLHLIWYECRHSQFIIGMSHYQPGAELSSRLS